MSRDMFLFFFFSILSTYFIKEIQSKCHGNYNSINDGVVGGQTTTIEQHPYQVNLVLELQNANKAHFCGGSIISARYILTAAHCVYGVSVAHVRVGSSYYNQMGTVYTSSQLFYHPKYVHYATDYDVGLIDLERNIYLDEITTKAISLPTPGVVVQPGMSVVVTGWGDTKENGSISMQLMEVTIPTVSHAQCKISYEQISLAVTERMFCASLSQGGQDSCQGDSGGPAVDATSGVQLGVVSFGHGCARPGFPGVYADLSIREIRGWIRSRTGV